MAREESSSNQAAARIAGSRRSTPLPFHAPWIDHREIREVLGLLSAGTLTTGPLTRQFEEAFARYVGSKYAIAVKSSTAALHLALDTVGLQPGDEVITTVYALGTTSAPIVQLKARPVLVDIEPRTLMMDPAEVKRKITGRTRAIIPFHLAGLPCHMDQILELAAQHDLRIVEDAAHALPTQYKGRMVGSIGDLTAFSFGPLRSITAADGGMITTDRDDYAERLMSRRVAQVHEGVWEDSPLNQPWQSATSYPGYTDNMNELNAAIGLQQLMKLERFHAIRSYHASLYSLGLSDLPELRLPELYIADAQHAWYLYTIRLRPERLSIDWDTFVRLLREENIRVGARIIPLHLYSYYRDAYGYQPDDFPNALQAYCEAVSLPIYPRMTEGDVWDVILAVRRIVGRYKVGREL